MSGVCKHATTEETGSKTSNMHAGVRGRPILEQSEKAAITKGILAIRGVNRAIHKKAHDEGSLKLERRPLAYKGTSTAWLRNIEKKYMLDSWTHEDLLPDDRIIEQEPLKVIACPGCKAELKTKTMELKVKVGFSQLTYHKCRDVESAANWRCPCGIKWRKCDRHVHPNLYYVAREVHVNRIKRVRTTNGGETPMPKKRCYESVAVDAHHELRHHFLRPGTVLAARFPHRVSTQ